MNVGHADPQKGCSYTEWIKSTDFYCKNFVEYRLDLDLFVPTSNYLME